MQKTAPLLLLCLVIGSAIGFGAGHWVALRPNTMAGVEIPQEPRLSPEMGKSALGDALLIPDPLERIRVVLALLPTMGPEALPEVRRVLDVAGPDRDPTESVALLRWWARQDPAAAMEWAYKRSPLNIRLLSIPIAAEEWASADPQAAVEGVRALTGGAPGPNADVARVGIMRGWAQSGRYAGVEDHLIAFTPGIEQQRAISAFARRMIWRGGAQAVEDWAQSLPDSDEPGRFKLTVFRQVASELTIFDPALGVAWCEAHCDGPYGGNILKLVAARWAAKDGRAAMEWVSQRPPGDDTDLAVAIGFRAWWQRDRESAAKWLEAIGREKLPPSLSAAVPLYAIWLADEDPQEAVLWARLAPERRRENILVEIVRRWRSQDDAAAEAWLRQSSLSEKAREKARSPVAGRSPS